MNIKKVEDEVKEVTYMMRMLENDISYTHDELFRLQNRIMDLNDSWMTFLRETYELLSSS